ncbi:MAG: thioesterase family protein [Xanthobacteraceae bacterium]|nr:thioesterase family protein [Xanthobacteraceae bacterium]QYK44576.1 MAG: thioesterase family protein [Xanthobacteraceae bacterium]
MTDTTANIKAGMTGAAELVVGEEHTAPRVGSGKIRVLATPVMINLIEAAALKAAEHLLPAGHQSLGTLLNVKHIAATPVGMKIRATATVTGVEGRNIFFDVTAEDEKETIGGGTHERVVVNVERFDKRVQRKISGQT